MNNNLDISNFRQFILDTPSQFEVGFSLAKNIKVDGKYNSITISGMGGSALPANLIRTYCHNLFNRNLDQKYFEIYVNRYYALPPEAKNTDTLNIIASYSGNTEETISAFEEVRKLNVPLIGISSGGELEKLCKEHNFPHIKLPIPYPNYQPRMGTGYFFASILQVLINQNMIPDVTQEILDDAGKFSNSMSSLEEKGKALAEKLKGKTPVIYSSPKYKSVAMIWKIKINENAKTPAFWNFFPELNHNEMVGFSNPQAKFFIVMLKDTDDNPKNLSRYQATSDLLKEKEIESEIIEMEGESVFSKMFLSITYADWTSYYLALTYGQDPTPVEMVEKLKEILI
jgi:glucose/mannose-6-phosphate isomerase